MKATPQGEGIYLELSDGIVRETDYLFLRQFQAMDERNSQWQHQETSYFPSSPGGTHYLHSETFSLPSLDPYEVFTGKRLTYEQTAQGGE